MNRTRWIIFTAIVVAVFGWLIFYSNKTKTDTNVSNVDENSILAASQQNGNIADHVYGNIDSKVTLVEYGDFQCSGCAYQHKTTKPLVEEYAEEIRFVFRNYTLTEIHPNAKAAAAAAEAAGLQGKYWEMHNRLYETQSDWDGLNGEERTDFFVNTAKVLGIKDEDKFIEDMSSDAVKDKIAFDKALGQKIKIGETPTFYLNGSKIDPDIWGDADKFKALIQAEIEKVAAKNQ